MTPKDSLNILARVVDEIYKKGSVTVAPEAGVKMKQAIDVLSKAITKKEKTPPETT